MSAWFERFGRDVYLIKGTGADLDIIPVLDSADFADEDINVWITEFIDGTMAVDIAHDIAQETMTPEEQQAACDKWNAERETTGETRMNATYQTTTDANAVTRVWASFSYNDVVPEYDTETSMNPPDNFDARLMAAYPAFESAIYAKFPNATDVMIESTGWEGDWAQFSPRAETEDGTPYEFFFDWLISVTDSLG